MSFGLILLAVSVIWVASEVMLVVLRRSNAGSQDRDAGSLLWLNVVIYGSVTVAVSIGLTGHGLMNGARHVLPWIGLVLIVLGLAIRWTAILTLRQYFTVDVAIQADHRIIQKGLYRFVRHPAYTGAIVSFLGLGMAFSNWLAICVILVPVFIAFSKRIQIEEQALMDEFGTKYTEYCRNTRRLLPWIY